MKTQAIRSNTYLDHSCLYMLFNRGLDLQFFMSRVKVNVTQYIACKVIRFTSRVKVTQIFVLRNYRLEILCSNKEEHIVSDLSVFFSHNYKDIELVLTVCPSVSMFICLICTHPVAGDINSTNLLVGFVFDTDF